MEESPVIEENELRAAISEAQSEQGELLINTDIEDSSSTDSACTTGTRTSPPRNLPSGQSNNGNYLNRSHHDTPGGSQISNMEIEGRSMENQNQSNATTVLRRSVETAHSFVSPPETPRHAPTPMPGSRPSTADPAAAAAAAFAHAQAQTMHQRQMQYADRRTTAEAYGHPAHYGIHSASPAQQQHRQLHLPSYREAFAHRLQTHHQYDPRSAAAAAAMYNSYGAVAGSTYGAAAAAGAGVYGSPGQQQQYFHQQQQQHYSQAVYGHPGYHSNRQRFPFSAADVHHQQQQQQQVTYGAQQQQQQYHHAHHENRQQTGGQHGRSEGSGVAEQPEAAAASDTSNQQQCNVVEAIHNALIGLGADPGNIGSVNTLPRGEHVILLPHAGNPSDHLFTQVLIAKTSYQLMSIPSNSIPTPSNSRPQTAAPQPPSNGGGQGHTCPNQNQGMHQRQQQQQPNQWNQNQGTRYPQHGHQGTSPQNQMNEQHRRQSYYSSSAWMTAPTEQNNEPPNIEIHYFPTETIPVAPVTGVTVQLTSTPVQGFDIKAQPVTTPSRGRGRGGNTRATAPKKAVRSKGKDLRSLGIPRSNRGGRRKTEAKPRAPRGSKRASKVPTNSDEGSTTVVKIEPADENKAGEDSEEPASKIPKLPFLTITKVTSSEATTSGSQQTGECPGSKTSTVNSSEDPTLSNYVKPESEDSDCVEVSPELTQPPSTPSTSRELRKRKPVLYFDPSEDPKPKTPRATKRPKKEPVEKPISARRKRHLENLEKLRQMRQKPFEELDRTGIRLLPPKRYATSKKIIFVDPKQYNRIMERRRVREMMEASGRLPLHRSKTYIHESRHKHAVTRPRYPNGKFMKKCDILALEAQKKSAAQEPAPNPDDVFKKPLPPQVAAAQRAAKKANAKNPQTQASPSSKIPAPFGSPQSVHQQIMLQRQRKMFQLQFKRLGADQKEALMRVVQSRSTMPKELRANAAKPTAPQMQLMINLMKKLYERNVQAAKRKIPATVVRESIPLPEPTLEDTSKQQGPSIVISIESAQPQAAELKIPEITLTAIK